MCEVILLFLYFIIKLLQTTAMEHPVLWAITNTNNQQLTKYVNIKHWGEYRNAQSEQN